MKCPTWIGSRRVVTDGGLRRVVTEVRVVEREVPIVVCVAADAVTIEHGT